MRILNGIDCACTTLGCQDTFERGVWVFSFFFYNFLRKYYGGGEDWVLVFGRKLLKGDQWTHEREIGEI